MVAISPCKLSADSLSFTLKRSQLSIIAYVYTSAALLVKHFTRLSKLIVLLQRVSILVSIACYAKRCISYRKSVRPSDRLSVTRWYQAKTTQATIMGLSSSEDPVIVA